MVGPANPLVISIELPIMDLSTALLLAASGLAAGLVNAIAGGGQTFSSGGGYVLAATIGQPGAGLLGGSGYVLSGGSAEVANNIIYPAVRGNYIVTPSNLKGTEPIYFVGAPPPSPETGPRADAQSSATSATR